MQKTEKIWMDGKILPWDQANVHVLTHTLHYGVGVFEGIRYYDCGDQGVAAFRLKDHMKRFAESAHIVCMKLPYTTAELVDACLEVIRINKLKSGYLRPLAFISEGPQAGLWAFENPIRVAIMTWGWGTYLGDEGVANGIRAKVSSFTRLHRNISMTKAKVTANYANSVMAKREIKMAGYDEAILLDPEGCVAEGTGENIFIVRDGVVRTPPAGSILMGLTRDSVMTFLRSQNIPIVEERLTRDDVYIADEAFLTGTAAEITPIRELDERMIGAGKPGPITKKIQSFYTDVTRGKLPQYKNWLSFVER